MFVAPINPNVVQIPIVQTGCCKSEFDSTYPIHLNGIIRQDEFQESIANINKAISSRKYMLLIAIVAALCMIGGMILLIVGGVTAVSSRTHGFPVLIGVGIGVFFLGMMVSAIGCPILQCRLTVRMQRAVANESMKYSTRSPTPCSWRLDSTRIVAGAYRNRRVAVIYHILIEIGHAVGAGNGYSANQYNQTYNSAPSYFSQASNMPPPPPYNGYPSTEFCSRCGKARENPIAKFCSSCGQPFNT